MVQIIETDLSYLTGYEKCKPHVRRIIDVASRQEGLSHEIISAMALYHVFATTEVHIQDPSKALRSAIPNVERDLRIDLDQAYTFRSITRTVSDHTDAYERFQQELTKQEFSQNPQ